MKVKHIGFSFRDTGCEWQPDCQYEAHKPKRNGDEMSKRTVYLLDEPEVAVSTAYFQRPKKEAKVAGIVKAAKAGRWIPPIQIAKLPSGEHIVVDGQHRYEALQRYPFDLAADIRDRSETDACLDFIAANSTATKVSMKHRFEKDPGRFAGRIRSLAQDTGADVTQVLNTLFGVATRQRTLMADVTKAEWATAELVLKQWSGDKRWKTNHSIYAWNGTLMMVGALAKRAANPKRTVVALKALDYTLSGALKQRYGTSGSSQKEMQDYANKKLAMQL